MSTAAPMDGSSRSLLALGLLALGLLAACLASPVAAGAAHAVTAASSAGNLKDCRALFAALDSAVDTAGVRDAQYARVEGYRYLRIDRLLAGPLRPDPRSENTGPAPPTLAFDLWIDALMERDQDARAVELGNLPLPEGAPALAPWGKGPGEWLAQVKTCGPILTRSDLVEPDDRLALVSRSNVPEAYVDWQRVVGLYPLAAPFFLAGVSALHEDLARPFRRRHGATSDGGTRAARGTDAAHAKRSLIRYEPAPTSQTKAEPDPVALATALGRLMASPYRLHDETDPSVAALVEHHAPVFEVETATDDDRPGTPFWPANGPAEIDVSRPTAYVYVSHTSFGGRFLAQINYVLWFPSRPPAGAVDLLAGHLDGITYRVTLDGDGQVLMRDSMHNCGCYHFFVPSSRLALRKTRWEGEEPPLIPHVIDRREVPSRAVRTVVRLTSGTHYIEDMAVEAPDRSAADRIVSYANAPYRELRGLPAPGGIRRSLFGTKGIVAGTERAERFFFWPMGVPDPGAMRQAGHHAIAFVGRRHFDDPFLIERYFERRQW